MNSTEPDLATRGNGWKSRKLWFCVFMVSLTTVLLWFSKVTGQEWLAVATACIWAYVVGNVGTTAADSLAKILAAVLLKKQD